MKITFFMECYWKGGLDTFVINLMNNWPAASDELTLICNKTHSGIAFIEDSLKSPCRVIKHNIATYQWFFNKPQEITVFDRIEKIIFKLGSPILRYVFLIYNILSLKKVLLAGNPDRLMIINGGYPGGDSCRAAAITWGIFGKKPYSIHNFHGIVVRPKRHIKLQEYLVDALISRFTKDFVTVSCAAAELMSCRGRIYKRNRVSYIYNGINMFKNGQNTNSADIKLEIGIPATSRFCLMLGNYGRNPYYDKGYNFLFQAFKKVVMQIPAAHLLVCGYGDDTAMEVVRRLVLSRNMEGNVHLSGFREDIPSLLRCTDVLLVSAQAFESFGFPIIEAMAHSVPVVATRVGAIPEVVGGEGEGGYCIAPDDVYAYANCIITLLRDDNLRKEQGEKGFLRYKKFFTASHMSEEYATLVHNG